MKAYAGAFAFHSHRRQLSSNTAYSAASSCVLAAATSLVDFITTTAAPAFSAACTPASSIRCSAAPATSGFFKRSLPMVTSVWPVMIASRRLLFEPEHPGSIRRDHFVDVLVAVTEVHAQRDAAAESFERREHAHLTQIRTDHGLLDAGRLDVMAQVFTRGDLELRSLQEHANGMFDKGAHRGDALDVVEAGADDLFGMREREFRDAAAFGFLEDQPGFADMNMPAREQHVVLGDHVQHFL